MASSGEEWQFHISTVKAHIGRYIIIYTVRFIWASNGQEWQYDISTVRARTHIGRSTGRSTPKLVPSSGQE